VPSANRIYTELRDRGFELLLVNFREDPELVRRTARERGYTAPILLDQTGDLTGRVYGVFGPPTMYFVDRQGRLVGRAAGPRDWAGAEGRRFIEGLLDQAGGQ
jgi:hypothetical protein